MSNVYLLASDRSTQAMQRVRCKSEDAELQSVLEKNHDLLPGDQIDPLNPRRWLLIQREMSVPDPSSGSSRWSIDFLFVDQDAIPTFVECKRYNDTRARREVVGQMLEYVANGQFYWSKEEMQGCAEASALRRGSNLRDAVTQLLEAKAPDERASPDDFFLQIEKNLRESQVRIVFFLEESSMELRSLVDFLNKQMERTEVVLVEARQYSLNGTTVIVPNLFGYTEQARQVKQSARVDVSARPVQAWDDHSFMSAIQSRLSQSDVACVRKLTEFVFASSFKSKYGNGRAGTLAVYHPTIAPTSSFFGLFADGKIWFGFSSLKGSESAERLRDFLKDRVVSKLGFPIAEDYASRWPTFPISEWDKKVTDLIELLKEVEAMK